MGEGTTSPPENGKILTPADIYHELGEDYRYHLKWRERLLVGFVAAVGVLAVAFQARETYRLATAFAGVTISLAIFFFEERCHEILIDRRRVGSSLERVARCEGFYASGLKLQLAANAITHTTVLRWLYFAGAVISYALLLAVIFVGSRPAMVSKLAARMSLRIETLYFLVTAVLALAPLVPFAYAIAHLARELWRERDRRRRGRDLERELARR
jgi:hypothetical protein